MGEFNISVACVTFHSFLSLNESPPPLGSGSYRLILLITLHFLFCEKSLAATTTPPIFTLEDENNH